MALVPHLLLNSGCKIPQIGFGTFNVIYSFLWSNIQAGPNEIGKVIEAAINAGYRHFDCASFYGNEKEIGDTLKACMKKYNIKREDLFITSKVS